MTKELEVTIKAAKEAGKILKENFHKVNPVTVKTGGSWVTEIDKLSESKIISVIRENFPGHSINAEESGFSKETSEYLWLVDPLDGTTNYARGVPIFAVSIALAHKGKVRLGVVYDPMQDELYTAEAEKSAQLNGLPAVVSETKNLSDFMVGYARPLVKKEQLAKIFQKVEKVTRTPKILGSMALHLGYVAAGRSDVAILLSPNPWDLAAGALIVEEAGGKVTDFEEKPWSLESKNLVASNGKIHEQLLEILNS